MSFKRAGDDSHMLSTQRHQRVANLLHEDIQDEELSRLSNGKFMCTLCYSRPIFDTVNMFMVHKHGKKHQQSLLYQEQKDQELKDLIIKRTHEHTSHLQNVDDQTAGDLVTAVRKPPAKQYKQKKPYERKHVLEIDPSKDGCMIDVAATQVEELPGNKHTSYHGEGKVNHNSSLNKCGQKFTSKGHRYSVGPGSHESEQMLKPNSVSKFVAGHLNEQSVNYYKNRKSQARSVSNTVNEQLADKPSASTYVRDPVKSWDFYKKRKETFKTIPVRVSNKVSPSCKDNSTVSVGQRSECQSGGRLTLQGVEQHGVEQHMEQVMFTQSTNKDILQKQLKAIGSGWKRDWDGRWVKDEDAEFDSDEEPPDVT